MPSAHGSGWVQFRTIHKYVTEAIRKHCRENERNDLTELPDGTFIWRRDPDELGRGVSENNQRGDFIRIVAYAVFTFKVSTVVNPENRAWKWNYRTSVEPLVQVIAHGWNRTKIETDIVVSELELIEYTETAG